MSTPIAVTIASSRSQQGAPAASTTNTTFDASQPYIRFPPFPAPPEGVAVVPFSTFKPAGIYVVEDPPPGYVERDGRGMPTIGLRVKHALPDANPRRKKKARIVTDATGHVRRLAWHEEWEAGEPLRRMTAPVDPSVPRDERLHQASQDFKAERPWPLVDSGVPQLWDAFRLYLGIITNLQPSVSKKQLKMLQAAGNEDDDEDDEEAYDAPREQVATGGDQTKADEEQSGGSCRPETPAEEQQNLSGNFPEETNSRMDAFFNDTETNIKIFFSSHYRDKGLMWSEPRTHDGPILIQYFLNFLLRNRVFPEPEYEKGMRRALDVVATARKELPATFVIGRAIPDGFSMGCERLWGGMTYKQAQIQCTELSNGSPDEEQRKADDLDASAAQREEDVDAFKAAVGQTDVEIITPETVESLAKEVQKAEAAADANVNGVDSDGWGGSPAAGWNTAPADGWGTGTGWHTEDTSNSWVPVEPNPLMATLGPTILPLTHTTGIVERSTRRIVTISPPEKIKPAKKGKTDTEQVEEELRTRFAKMVLAPWTGWDQNDSDDTSRPSILFSSRGAAIRKEDKQDAMDTSDTIAPAHKPHNPFADEITVLIELSGADKLIVGMGLRATWIQLARQDISKTRWLEVTETPQGSSGSVGEYGAPTTSWYIEHLIAILPSFHTDV
ncbi:hypothetical protein WOLCODRAFT_137071 [Wolfiporia cocos MD-104 SS10]|uniref:Uncharacterized protein n=1 Tax=Wolfiporia cocos (strain MD-104) TaxID=742152 RepID=A0A2H3JFC5_WOLCO|nr:hypothetical protein WOLCODRAFT_137071 [Wolfiporia cocos MD-104 SS10]